MRVALAADHGGAGLKAELLGGLAAPPTAATERTVV